MTETSKIIHCRYDFVLFFDVQDGNPNGDPDAGNMPRVDPETGHGLVTDVCIKRKVRNYVLAAKNGASPYDIFIKEKAILNQVIAEEFTAIGVDLAAEPKNTADGAKRKEKGKAQGGEVDAARIAMCTRYFDVRTFGAVMSTGANAGQVRGPVQLTFARSIDPILALEHSITRMAVTTPEDAEKQKGDNRTMGRKATVPYGLYRAHGFISSALAERVDGRRVQGTGFTEADLSLFWTALDAMFDHDHSAARGLMSTRAVVIFEHASKLGEAPAHKLFSKVTATRRKGVDVARKFEDYELHVDGKPFAGGRRVVKVEAMSEDTASP